MYVVSACVRSQRVCTTCSYFDSSDMQKSIDTEKLKTHATGIAATAVTHFNWPSQARTAVILRKNIKQDNFATRRPWRRWPKCPICGVAVIVDVRAAWR